MDLLHYLLFVFDILNGSSGCKSCFVSSTPLFKKSPTFLFVFALYYNLHVISLPVFVFDCSSSSLETYFV